MSNAPPGPGPSTTSFTRPSRRTASQEHRDALPRLPEVSPWEAKLLLVLAQGGEASTRELVEALALPQPRVSVLTRDLLARGWVTYRVDKRAGAGRPRHVYRLRKGLDALLEELRRRETLRHEENVAAIERVLRAARRVSLHASLRPREEPA